MLTAVRPGAAFASAPLFGGVRVPVVLRVVLALAIGVSGVRFGAPALPPEGLLSLAGAVLVAGEVLIGALLGFALQAGFAAALIAGEAIGNAMGLGLAASVDPATGAQSSALGQILSWLATALFLAIDGHLVFVAIVVESWRALPIGGEMLSASAFWALILLGGAMFSSAVALAMPVVTGVVLIQLVMGVLARAAPAMNLFAVGLPAALLGGLVLFAVAAPMMAQTIAANLANALDAIGGLPR